MLEPEWKPAGYRKSVFSFFRRECERHIQFGFHARTHQIARRTPRSEWTSGVMERLPSTISLITRGTTPTSRAMAFCEIPLGLRYSSSRILPGVIGSFMFIFSNVIGPFWLRQGRGVETHLNPKT